MANHKTASWRSERLFDWIGFLFYTLLAVRIIIQTPTIGLWFLPTFLQELMTGVAFLIRHPSRRTAAGIGPSTAAYAGTFGMPIFLFIAGKWYPGWLELSQNTTALQAGFGLWLFGGLAALWTLWTLRRSFSIVPQARALVISGPYRLVRHPVYLAYLLQQLGFYIAHPTLPLGIALVAWLLPIGVRMHYEEAVLEREFPEYGEYRKSVGIFGPKFMRSGRPEASVQELP
jgi:protein-S-isoprenylcysteine O-methyltransferase Ste14